MVVVLLCQGLIFENENPNSSYVFGFGVLVVVFLTGTLLMTSLHLIRRMLKNHKPIVIPKQALQVLSPDFIAEIFNIHSFSEVNSFGSLEINRRVLLKRLTQPEQEELFALISHQYSMGNKEYEKFAQSVRGNSIRSSAAGGEVSAFEVTGSIQLDFKRSQRVPSVANNGNTVSLEQRTTIFSISRQGNEEELN